MVKVKLEFLNSICNNLLFPSNFRGSFWLRLWLELVDFGFDF